MFRHCKMMLLLVAVVQVMNVAASVDNGTQQEWGVDQWMASCNCKNDRNTELFKQFSAFSRELINNYNNKEQQWKSEQVELLSQAAEYKVSLHQLNQSYAQATAECRKEKLDLSLKLQSNEQELTKLQQELKDQFIKYEALLEEIQIAIIDKTSYERITVICKAIYNAKCVGVRCYDVKLAQDMKEHNYLTAIAMYDDLITKLTPCLRIPNIHIQQFIDEKADLHSKLKDLEKSMHTAAKDGNVQLIRNQIAKGVNVNATNEDKNSGLILATWNNHTTIIKILIEAGAYLDTQNKYNDTALILAAYQNRTDICKMLLDAGADANIENSHGDVALTYAVWRNNVEAVKMVLENGAEVDIATNEGNTPLHTAARYGCTEIAKVLVEHDAKLNVTNDEGRTPLGRALFYNQAQMVRYLMSIGATE